MSRRRGGRPTRRSPRKPTRSLLVCVEGEKTEHLYLTRWRRLYRGSARVDIDPPISDPLALVEYAAKRRGRDSPDSRSRPGTPYDEVWCVFDVDDHPRLNEAIRFAEDHDIRVALSNPCIELWFLLHFRDQTAHLDRRDAQKECEKALGCGKVLSDEALDLLIDAHDEAVRRAKALATRHRGNGSPVTANPSSNIWELIEAIQKT